jgi:hypothetical protein
MEYTANMITSEQLGEMLFKTFRVNLTERHIASVANQIEETFADDYRRGGRSYDQVVAHCLRGRAIEFGLEQVGFTWEEPEGGNIDISDSDTYAVDLFHPELNIKLQMKSFGPHAVFGFTDKTLKSISNYTDKWDFLVAAGIAEGRNWREWYVKPKLIVPSQHWDKYVVHSSRGFVWDGTYKFDHYKALENGHCSVNTNVDGGISVKRSA